MVLITLFILCSVAFVGAFVGPKVYRQCLESKQEKEREYLLSNIEQNGSPEEVERVRMIREREREITLKLIEHEQALKVLESPSVRAKLESACIDVELLQTLIKDSKNDPILERFKQLEEGLERKKK